MNGIQLTVRANGVVARVKLEEARSIAIEQTFDDQQPNHFATPDARRRAYEGDGFIGDTSRGGSCNVDVLELIPHCNGTHTETVGHILRGDYPVSRRLLQGPILAQLATVAPVSAQGCSDRYDPPLEAENQVITAEAIDFALTSTDRLRRVGPVTALILRTTPNPESKRAREYRFVSPPPFLTGDAMTRIVAEGFEHLLLDLPSVDRMQDQGRLSNHCLFWKVSVDERKLLGPERLGCTITEMVYIDDRIADGLYLLDLQVAALNTDASPSRPILFPLEVTP